jgi:hypothetical protein
MPGTDSDFERTFSDLAFASLRDRAPSLFDYLVGFQVLDQNEDQTHAVGVFGCRVGSEWVYLPVFFNSGELRGSELMYLKDQDMFVPLQENWVSYVLNRKPYVLGETTGLSHHEINNSPPDFSSFSGQPGGWNKSASSTHVASSGQRLLNWKANNPSTWVQPFVKACQAHVVKQAAYKASAERLHLPQFIADNGPAVNTQLINFMTKSAAGRSAGEAILDYYPIQTLMISRYSMPALTFSDQITKQAAAKTCKCGGYIQDHICRECGMHQKQAAFISGPVPGTKKLPPKTDSTTAQHKLNVASLTKSANDKEDACDPKQSTPKDDTADLPWNKGKSNLPKVKVITSLSQDAEAAKDNLSEDDIAQLLRGEAVVKDLRTGTDRIYHAEINKTVTSPDSTGIYKMLVKGGSDFDDILVIYKPLTIGSGHCTAVTAVQLSSKNAVNVNPRQLNVLQTFTKPTDFLRFYADQTAASEMTEGGTYVLITPDGKGTIPFRVAKKQKDADGLTTFYVKAFDDVSRFDDYKSAVNRRIEVSHKFTSGYISFSKFDYAGSSGCCEGSDPASQRQPDWIHGRKIILADRGGSLVNVGDTLFVPDTAKAVKLDQKREYDSKFPVPGTVDDAMVFILNSNFVSSLKVHAEGAGQYSIKDGESDTADISKRKVDRHQGKSADYFNKKASHVNRNDALAHLICGWNLSEPDARLVLQTADQEKQAHVLVKTAEMPGWFNEGPTSPSVPNPQPQNDSLTGRSAVGPETYEQPVPQMQAQQNNRQMYNPDPRRDVNPYQLTEQAAKTGQKDVLDAGVVGSLLKVVDSDALVDKYIGDLFLGLDRVGRVLFLFYQHNDSFRERYGDEDMQELEDSLKNVFKGMGDLILFLKAKTCEKSPETQKTEVDLSETANAGAASNV